MTTNKQLEKKIRTSGFDLEDLLCQLRQFNKMGMPTQLIEMLPGMPKLAPAAIGEGEESQLRKMEAIILSMTPQERHSPAIINGSRRKRIAQGSGTSTRDVNQLLNQFYQIQKLTKMAAKGKLPKNLVRMFR